MEPAGRRDGLVSISFNRWSVSHSSGKRLGLFSSLRTRGRRPSRWPEVESLCVFWWDAGRGRNTLYYCPQGKYGAEEGGGGGAVGCMEFQPWCLKINQFPRVNEKPNLINNRLLIKKEKIISLVEDVGMLLLVNCNKKPWQDPFRVNYFALKRLVILNYMNNIDMI